MREPVPRYGVPRRPRAVDFGDRTWVDVQKKLAKWARYQYPRVDRDLIEEALQDAVVDGMTYWQTLPSSHSHDAERNFAFAVYRGQQFLTRQVGALAKHRAEVGVLDDAVDRADDSPGPEEVLENNDLAARAHDLLAELDPDELSDFFTYFGDDSQREVAARLGVSKSEVGRRRAARRLDLQDRARKHGLL